VDGSLIGLSNNPSNTIADLKSGEFRDQNAVALTGYVLALEADEMTDLTSSPH